MRKFLFFFLIIFLTIFLSIEKEIDNKTINNTEKNPIHKNESSKENKSLNKIENSSFIEPQNKTLNGTEKEESKSNKKPKKKVVPPPVNISFFSPNDYENATNKEVFLLNDLTFDLILQNGNNYKWLVILYSETCGHCQHARRDLRKILPQYRYSNTIRFAEIEINRNPMTNLRFDIEGVPYIFLLQNNSIYEMDLYPNQNNYKTFIETDFKNLTAEELKPFPPMVPILKFGWLFLQNFFNVITNSINEILYDMGYEFEFTPLLLLMAFVGFFASICILEYVFCYKCCPDEEKKEFKKEEENKKEKEEKEDKKENENIEEEKENEKEDKEKKEATEEEKIEREKKIEKKNKEKEDDIKKEEEKKESKDNNNNKEAKNKRQKKKKKE